MKKKVLKQQCEYKQEINSINSNINCIYCDICNVCHATHNIGNGKKKINIFKKDKKDG